MAPEIFTGSYGLECDMWSLGVILFVLLNGNYPFDGNNAKEVVQKIQFNDLHFESEEWSSVSSDAKELVANLLMRDKHERFTAQEALECSWIQQYANNGTGITEESSTGGEKNVVKTESEEIEKEEHHKVDNSINIRIYNLAKRVKVEKQLKNFLADLLTIELQAKLFKKFVSFDKKNANNGQIKDSQLGKIVREFYDEYIDAINVGQGFNRQDSFNLRKRSEILKIFKQWDRLCCNRDKTSSGSQQFIDYEEFMNDCTQIRIWRTQKLVDLVDTVVEGGRLRGSNSISDKEVSNETNDDRQNGDGGKTNQSAGVAKNVNVQGTPIEVTSRIKNVERVIDDAIGKTDSYIRRTLFNRISKSALEKSQTTQNIAVDVEELNGEIYCCEEY